MGLIMKNGISYGGGSGTAADTSHIELTFAEYKKLEKNGQVDSNATYFITDENMNSVNYASSIAYDNTKTGLDVNNIQDAIDSCFQSGSNFKANVASGITAKGVSTNATDSVETILNNLASIATGSGNATKKDVLSGKTFTNDDGEEYTGEMPNIASIDTAVSSTYVTNGSNGTGIYARINPGAHIQTASSGYPEVCVPQNQIATMFSGNATAAQILKNKTAWVNGTKITGTLVNNTPSNNVLECCVASGGSQSATMGIGGKGTSNTDSTFTGNYLKFVYSNGGYTVTAVKAVRAMRYLWYPSGGLKYNDIKTYSAGATIIPKTSTYICVMSVCALEAL